MTKNYDNLIRVTKQAVNDYNRTKKFSKLNSFQQKEQLFWYLAGIHQSALFILSLDEYYKYMEEVKKIESSFTLNSLTTGQLTLF